jgi:hypothetical protein
MLTPWFAVATGFVVAAGLWIYSPHAELKFPGNALGVVPCKSVHCGQAPPNGINLPDGAASMPITNGQSGGRVLTSPARTVTFSVLWQSRGKFGMLIRLTGSRVPRIWHLTFELPGVKIIGVQGAAWHPAGSSGGTASWQPSYALWRAAEQSGSGDHLGHEAGTSFIVVGKGTPVAPTFCSFNRASCNISWAASGGQRFTPLQNR